MKNPVVFLSFFWIAKSPNFYYFSIVFYSIVLIIFAIIYFHLLLNKAHTKQVFIAIYRAMTKSNNHID